MHTGDLLVELLLEYGLDTLFGVPGGQTVALYDAIQRRPERCRHITLRDERSTAYAADAWAKMTHRVGVCNVTVGPGAVKLPSGLLESFNASVPILAIVSDVGSEWAHLQERGAATQAMDQEAMLRPLCKWVSTLRSPAQLPTVLGTALRRATTGRPGPVALIIPHDLFDQRFEAGDLERIAPMAPATNPDWGRFPHTATRPDDASLEAAAALLRRARRPLMVAGGGALLARAEAEVRGLAEQLTMPVATTFTGRGVIEDSHPLAVGLLGNIGTGAARAAAEAADVVLLVGNKSAQNSTLGWTLPRPDQTVIHLDIDPAEIGKVFPTALGLVGDARLGLAALSRAVGSLPPDADRAAWVADLKRKWAESCAAAFGSDATPIFPQRVMAELAPLTSADDLVVCDASYPTGWGMLFHPIRRAGRSVLAPRGSAGLGYGLPAAIGAAVACPDRRVLVLAGDGGWSYSLGEMASVSGYDLNVKAVIFNNSSLAWIDHWHRIYFGSDGAPFRLSEVDFAAVARSFGWHSARVEQPGDLGDALRAALEHDGPALVDVIVSGEETPIPAYRAAMDRQETAGVRY
jgi:acetolactate synthase-1/2/3 large subunit